MKRSNEWMKFGGLVAVTLFLVAAFAGAVARPHTPDAAARSATAAAVATDRPAPVNTRGAAGNFEHAFTSVAEQLRPSVVFIDAETHTNPHSGVQVPPGFEQFFPQLRQPRVIRGQGSGFIISPDGYIVTNNHVITMDNQTNGAEKLSVTLFDKRVFNDVKVIGTDPSTDVAVIKIPATDLPAVSFGNSDSVRVGQWVLAIGNPLGQEFSFTVTAGIISAKGRVLNGLPTTSQYSIQDFLQTDAVINPGNSGGPLVGINGQVIGMNAAIASQTGSYEGYSFAIPINMVRSVAEQLIKNGKVTRAILGVAIREITPEDADYVGLKQIHGVVVNEYSMKNSPAERAGIKPGDVIVAVDGEPVNYVGQLQQIVGFKKPGDVVHITVYRKDGKHTLDVKLTEAPASETVASAASGNNSSAENVSQDKRLGITLRTLTPEVARSARIDPDQHGLAVTDVGVDSPARDRLVPWTSQAPGDIITSIDGTSVRTMADFDKVMKGVKAGAIISLHVYNPSVQGGASRVVRVRVPN